MAIPILNMRMSLTFLILATIWLTQSVPTASGFELFCGKENCYELLQIPRNSTEREIRKAYRKLSLELHPDKNPLNDTTHVFRKVVNAYEVLTDAKQREEYDDFLDHPEKYYWYYMEHMTMQYAPKTSVQAAISGILLVASLLHWYNLTTNHKSSMRRIKSSQEYQEAVDRVLASDLVKDISDEKESVAFAMKLVEERIIGLQRPTWKSSLPVKLACLPWHIAKLVYWILHWYICYSILKQDYNQEDKEYLVKQRLKIMTETQWQLMDQDLRNELVEQRVWEEKQWQNWLQQKRIEYNRRGKDAFKKSKKK